MKTVKAILFWLISWTWGLPVTLVGAIIALALLITGHKPHVFHCLVYFNVGKNWGGFNCGCFFFVDDNPSLHTKQHESGHGIQNLILGVFMPFLVSLPSAIRYWYREYLYRNNKPKYNALPPYDSAWFEGTATKLGEKYFN